VADVLQLFAAGLIGEQLLAEMPDLDLQVALHYAARLGTATRNPPWCACVPKSRGVVGVAQAKSQQLRCLLERFGCFLNSFIAAPAAPRQKWSSRLARAASSE